MKKRTTKKILSILLAASILLGAAGCAAARAADLMGGVSPNPVNGRQADATFTESMADFSIKLFKSGITDKENSLISPLSVTLALAMAANGANGETRTQMETLLGGGIPLPALNEYLYSYAKGLPNTEQAKLTTANAIWFCDDKNRLRVEPDFLQKNADYYGAAAFQSAFDAQTVKEINSWVKTNTNGMIDSILDKIDPAELMYLINAVAFDAKWQNVYYKESIESGGFTDIDGAIQSADFMYSAEDQYLDDGMATGFVKPYAGGGYSFVALLPNEGVSIEDYIASLSGSGFLETLHSARSVTVNAYLPKFSYDYEVTMNDALIGLGIPDAFNPDIADFSKMGTSPEGPLYIGKVLHKTFISVDELGTKAGAVTIVAMDAGAAAPTEEPKTVRLNRPFVYAIVDNATNLPVFLGTVMRVG
ncbi:MAG: serpin family protein [Firmicutes bacterium]|nr:serpin family protein [Bacillota bacterium]